MNEDEILFEELEDAEEIFEGEYKITEMFVDAPRFVTIVGERNDDKGVSFLLDDGSEVEVGKLKYLANDSGVWRVKADGEILRCTEEEIEFLYTDSFRNSVMTASFAHANWKAEFDYQGEELDKAQEATEEIREMLRTANENLSTRNAHIEMIESELKVRTDEGEKLAFKVSALEEEVVNLKSQIERLSKPSTKPAKKAEVATNESERLPSESEEK